MDSLADSQLNQEAWTQLAALQSGCVRDQDARALHTLHEQTRVWRDDMAALAVYLTRADAHCTATLRSITQQMQVRLLRLHAKVILSDVPSQRGCVMQTRW